MCLILLLSLDSDYVCSHSGFLYFVIIEKIRNRALVASRSLFLIQCKFMIEYDRYVWLKSDRVNFGQNRKFLYRTCHVIIPSHLMRGMNGIRGMICAKLV